MSNDEYLYYVQFLDDFSCFVWIYPLKYNSDTLAAFNHLLTMVKTQFGTTIKSLQSDNGGEYVKVYKFCAHMCIPSCFSLLVYFFSKWSG